MSNSTRQPAERSLWDQMSKAAQEEVKRQLKRVEQGTSIKESPKKNGFALKGYLRCELSAADKDAFKEWEAAQDLASCGERLIKAADSGYLVKLGENGPSFQASLCTATTGQPWEGYVLTAHAGSAARAAMLLVYKHEVMMQGAWSSWLTDEGEDLLR